MRLSPQFEKALIYATRIHGGKLRKKTRIPYIAHILGVTAIALEYGANETEAIAALLHDAVEDCGGAKRLRDIERKFGKKVARIDYRQEGERLWSRFNGGKQGALCYYRALVNAFSGKRIQPLVQEIDRALTKLELLSNNGEQVHHTPARK